MYLIVGLGNPGNAYKWTRHNVGFEVIDKLVFDYNINIKNAKHRAHIAEGQINGQKVIFAKPQTYMNLSGESVLSIMKYYKLEAENIIIVYDEIAIDVGEIRMKEKGSAGGHNGIKNIIHHLGTDEFLRVRVGVGEKPKHMVLSDYVLSGFLKEERQKIIDGITKAGEAVELAIKDSQIAAMNKYNVRKKVEKKDEILEISAPNPNKSQELGSLI